MLEQAAVLLAGLEAGLGDEAEGAALGQLVGTLLDAAGGRTRASFPRASRPYGLSIISTVLVGAGAMPSCAGVTAGVSTGTEAAGGSTPAAEAGCAAAGPAASSVEPAMQSDSANERIEWGVS